MESFEQIFERKNIPRSILLFQQVEKTIAEIFRMAFNVKDEVDALEKLALD